MSGAPTAYLAELDDYGRSTPSDFEYLKIPLPQEIERFKGLKTALKERHRVIREDDADNKDSEKLKSLYLKLVTPPKYEKENEEQPSYINIDFESERRRHSLELLGEGRSDDRATGQTPREDWLTENAQYYLTIPAEFTHRNTTSPIYGVEKGDEVVLEVDQEENEMRIYANEDYRHRDNELSQQGRKPTYRRLTFATIPLTLSNYADLTGFLGPGQRFRIVPFDVTSQVFKAEADKSVDEKYSPEPELLQQVVKNGNLPRCSPLKMEIKWDPEGQGRVTNERKTVLYTRYLADELRVVLPEKGTFSIWTETRNGTRYSRIDHDDGDSWLIKNEKELTRIQNWQNRYIENPGDEDHLTIYVPCTG
jgi:hypothetical protein